MSLPRLVAYARTSTYDQQSLEDSLRWQVAAAEALTAGRADIVEVIHEEDMTRAVPWARRPKAAQLLTALADPNRGWDGVVVGEPQRAFGNPAQVNLVMSQFAEYRAEFWTPETGGPADPENDAHDLVLAIFGSLARAERNRLRVRVRGAMRAMAPTGRFLGGRPPYGYVLVGSGIMHPNPEKARHGIELTHLVIDPDTAKVVRLIFRWRCAGVGFRTIAIRLTDDGVPSPSGADPARNPHRPGRAWATSAVRAIVMNPRYAGTGRFGAARKIERLYDPTDPAAGHVTRMVRSNPADVIHTPGAVPGIVDEDTWRRAQPGRSPAGPGPRPERPAGQHRYALRGFLTCDACGRKMQGHMVRRRSGAEQLGYRCIYRQDYPGDRLHPTTLFVAQHRVLTVVDEWLARLFDPAGIDETVEAILAADHGQRQEPPEVLRARRDAADAQSRIERWMAAIDKGLDPEDAVKRIATAKADLRVAQALIDSHGSSAIAPLDPVVLRSLLAHAGGLASLLAEADHMSRRNVYEAAGLALRYARKEEGEVIHAGLRVGFSRVGGGTCSNTTQHASWSLAS